MPRPVCTHCNKFMKCVKNGVWILEMGITNARSTKRTPISVTQGDRYKCARCHRGIIVGFGRSIEQFEEDDFIEFVEKIKTSGDEIHEMID